MRIERLVELLRESGTCVVLTGAGVSTESGIPDFRSPTGIWAQYDPMQYATIGAFLANPAKVWEFYGMRLTALGRAEPNDGYRAIAELEERGWVRALITQNVDGLHASAGSRDIIEVHGSLRDAVCLDCGTRVPMEDAVALLPEPPCPSCGRTLKPGVVMFGELLPPDAIDRAFRLAAETPLLLVVGSALEVYPVASLPEETLAAGGRLAVVNRGGTPFDARAAVVIDGGAGETLRALADAVASVEATG